MTPGEKIERALSEAGISQAEIARRLGVSPQAVNGWIRTGRITKDNLAAIARETGAGLEWLMDASAIEVAQERPRYGELRDVPIIGHAVATPDEDGFFDDMGFPPGAGDGFLPWPTKDRHAYALRVRGDSMQPRIRPGELIVVEPGAAVAPGNDVVVRMRDGRKMVKQLLIQRAEEVTLGSINQAHRQTTISTAEIESIHFVSAIVPRSAFVKETPE